MIKPFEDNQIFNKKYTLDFYSL